MITKYATPVKEYNAAQEHCHGCNDYTSTPAVYCTRCAEALDLGGTWAGTCEKCEYFYNELEYDSAAEQYRCWNCLMAD